jgi:hypothetical protein
MMNGGNGRGTFAGERGGQPSLVLFPAEQIRCGSVTDECRQWVSTLRLHELLYTLERVNNSFAVTAGICMRLHAGAWREHAWELIGFTTLCGC